MLQFLFFLFACNDAKEKNESTSVKDFSPEGKKVIVYTTADSSNYRLTATDTLSFADFDQPIETQPSIFVDPAHSFQTFLGIGGALTDASVVPSYRSCSTTKYFIPFAFAAKRL